MAGETKTCGCVLQTVVQFYDDYGSYVDKKRYSGWNFNRGDDIQRDGKLYSVRKIIIDVDEMIVKVKAYLWE